MVAWDPNMGVMGLGENGLKVPGGMDVAISPPPPNSTRGVRNMFAKTLGQKTFFLHTPSHNQIS
jgi:hypothetical protein